VTPGHSATAGAGIGAASLHCVPPPLLAPQMADSSTPDHEGGDPWYIELAESVPIWVWVILFLLPIISSIAQIFREEAERRERKRR
jgi:hypothetical protein